MSEIKEQQPAYISRVHLKGYKSIRDLEIDFKAGLNIIIGPNGSGKTNFLEFVKLCLDDFNHKNLTYEPIPFQSKIELIDRRQNFVSINVSTKFKIVRSQYYFIIEEENFLNQKKVEKDILTFSEIGNYINAESESYVSKEEEAFIGFFKPDFVYIKFGVSSEYDDKLRNPLQIFINRNEDRWLLRGRDFYVIFNLVNYFYKTEKIEEFISYTFNINDDFKLLLQKYSPIKDIKFNSDRFQLTEINENEYKLDNINLSFYVNNRWDYWQNLSDGTRRIFYIIAEIYRNTGPASTYFLEEPELGIHPQQLSLLMDFLREQSREKQIIITTHSPQVLNELREDELDRIIVTRHEGSERGTQMYHLSEEEKGFALQYMQNGAFLSDYWVQSGFVKEEAIG